MLKELFTAENGRWMQPEHLRESIRRFLEKEKSGVFELQIKRISDKRTNRQNKYYWALLSILAPAIGYESRDSMHCMILEECGLGKYINFRGKAYFEREHSHTFDIETFGKIIDKCFEIAAFVNEDRAPEEHIILPKPELGID